MALNPSATNEPKKSPIERANQLNDPQFENQQGYYPYDLTHSEMISPLFGQVTPSMHLDTVPGDRIVVHDNTKLIHNTINGNFLSTINQYVDCFYVALRSCYPQNYEKLIPNPTKGQDLPNSALPQVPFSMFVYDYLASDTAIQFFDDADSIDVIPDEFGDYDSHLDSQVISVHWANVQLSRLLFLSTILSRGQLLDYLGYNFDVNEDSPVGVSKLQYLIDEFQRSYYGAVIQSDATFIRPMEMSLTSDTMYFGANLISYHISTLSKYRGALSDIFEAGKLPYVDFDMESQDIRELFEKGVELRDCILEIFNVDADVATYIIDINTASNPFQKHHISLVKPLAYQQVIAQYFSNNTVDNIFTSDLFMQLLRATMYPSVDGFSSEPTFTYNGVTTEYDYISAGGFYHSLISPRNPGHLTRQVVFASLMFLLRRSLRYGDYFATARPNMLAIGQLGINVENGMVSPIDVTKNLLMQRYLHAANHTGSGFLQYYSSMYGVLPSDTGVIPRFISHRKIVLENRITNNTANDQGAQTTNLVGYSDDTAFDVFIDDFGVLISLQSFDVLPVYTSGIDACAHLSDRFDYFNPMLQNIGDQPIYLSEFIGVPDNRERIFGYTMRNAEYKYKISKAHGAFVNSLPGYLMKYPYSSFVPNGTLNTTLHIDPDFIRDKPEYLDLSLRQQTGISPAEYFHFIVAVLNQVQCARKIQPSPTLLF